MAIVYKHVYDPDSYHLLPTGRNEPRGDYNGPPTETYIASRQGTVVNVELSFRFFKGLVGKIKLIGRRGINTNGGGNWQRSYGLSMKGEC